MFKRFAHRCYCKVCDQAAIYYSRKRVLTEKEKKELSFTCNDCMDKYLRSRGYSRSYQLDLFS